MIPLCEAVRKYGEFSAYVQKKDAVKRPFCLYLISMPTLPKMVCRLL